VVVELVVLEGIVVVVVEEVVVVDVEVVPDPPYPSRVQVTEVAYPLLLSSGGQSD
jgi:hypothetical protein